MLSHHGLIAASGNGGTPAQTYALFSKDAARHNASITISEDGRTATRYGVAWNSAFLDIDKTSGVWALEVSQDIYATGNIYSLIGIDSDIASSLGAFIANGPYGLNASYAALGYSFIDGNGAQSYYDIVSTANHRAVIVFDFDTKRMYAKKAGTLQSRGASAGSGPFYMGMSLYATTQCNYTINTGQEAFTAENEALVAALEITLGKSINRGIWA